MGTSPSLAGRTALVTGASRGLGVLIARALAAEGAHVALAARTAEPLEALARELAAAGARAVAIPTDVSTAEGRERLLERAESELGALDILVNNAGVEYGGAFHQQDPDAVRAILATNLEGPMLLTRLALARMLPRRRGHVVNVASLAGKLGLPWASVYGASKAGLIAWSRALRAELVGTGVRVSVVSPGYVSETGMFAVHGQRAHWLTGESPPAAVARGVLRALAADDFEVIVNPKPMGPLLALHALMPGVVERVLRRAGFYEYARRVHGEG
jgi:short-subunit dehydrogenase